MDIQWILLLDIYVVLNMINAGMKIAIYNLHQIKPMLRNEVNSPLYTSKFVVLYVNL